MRNLFNVIAMTMLMIAATACSSDSGTTATDATYVRFYNASLNAGVHEVFLDITDDEYDPASIGRIDFADASSIITLEVDDYEMTVMRDTVDNVDEQITVLTSLINTKDSFMSLNIMLGDATQPELIEFEYDTSSLGDLDVDAAQFELYITNLSTVSTQLDVYMSTEEETFDQAQLITSLQYKEFSELQIMEQEIYKVYLTEVGSSEVIFESTPIPLSFLQTFILAIRDDSGIKGVSIDRITDSSVVYAYADDQTEAEIRFYQSKNTLENVDIYFGDVAATPLVENLVPGTLSENIFIDNNTYTVITTIAGQPEQINVRNLVLSIEEDDSKILMLYPDAENVHQGLFFEQQTRELAYENTVRVINIGKDEQEIDIYFLATDETLSTTEKYLRLIDYTETKDITLLNQSYRIFVTTEDDNGNLRSLYESEAMTLNDNKNYLMILEPDETTFSGYKLVIIEE